MNTFKPTKLALALKLALVAGVCQQAGAEPFPSRFDLLELDGSNGVAIIGGSAEELSGFSVSAAGDLNNDGISDVILGAYLADNTLGGVDSGRSYIIYGSNNTFSSPIELNDFSNPDLFSAFGGEAISVTRFSGHSVSGAGDFNDDGVDDFLIGAPGNRLGSPLQATSGRAYLGFGRAFLSNTFLGSFTGATGFKINAENAFDTTIGYSVSSAGDFNGDGIDDILIGATRADLGGNGRGGRSYILFGTSSITSPFEFELSALDGTNGVVIAKGALDNQFGYSVSSIGDFKGDKLDDVIIGSPGSSSNGNNSGNSYIVFGTDTLLTSP
ncbi:MAG: integrin alpha, partial [Pseudomonadota bacterium]